MTNLYSILKSRDTTLSIKIRLVKALVFPVVMCGCEIWTVKKAEHRRIDAFELWHWRRLLRVSWTARRSTQSVLKEISPAYSWEGLMLKLKLQYFGHLMWGTYSLGMTDAGKDWRLEQKGTTEYEMASPTQWTWVWASSGCWWWTGRPGVLQSMGSERVRQDWVTELNWTERSYQKEIKDGLKGYILNCNILICNNRSQNIMGLHPQNAEGKYCWMVT